MRLYLLFLLSCMNLLGVAQSEKVITVPVVVHVTYNQAYENITEDQIRSQLEAINADFSRSNADFANIPSVFAKLSASINIRFELAVADPNGRATTGIVRKKSTRLMWSDDDKIKSSAFGGSDPWDPTRYLNVWICNTVPGLSGYASLPKSDPKKDGVVIRFDAFGTRGSVAAPFNKGRTMTHEVGHWLGLKHLWGDAPCGDDGIHDTPRQRGGNTGSPSFPKITACNGTPDGEMFMNFMDFTNDASMGMFTEGQKSAMRAHFSPGASRFSLTQSNALSPATAAAAVSEEVSTPSVSVYPNPVVGNSFQLRLTAVGNSIAKHFAIIASNGQIVQKGFVQQASSQINVSYLAPGVYQVRLTDAASNQYTKFIKQ
ncbi:MAG: zinc-dependent metalloprotease [Bacteroidota bacterium]